MQLPRFWRGLVLAVSCAGVSTGLAQSTTPPPAIPPSSATADEVVRLPQFSVAAERSDAYRAVDTMSLARIRGAIIETPLSINVITRELIEDLGANSAYDATRYFAGISNGRGSGTAGGINDRQNFRGFESQTRTVDNFSSTFLPGTSTSIDTFEPEFIERVEVVLGPNAILSPTGTPGGSINIISKSPRFTQENSIKVILGNYNAQKVAIDSTGPLPFFGGKRLAYRVIATGQDTETYIPGSWRKYDIAAELTYKLNETSEITFKYFGVDYAAYENASAPNDNGWLVYDPATIGGMTLADTPTTPGVTYNGRNGVNTNSITTERTNQAQLLYTGTLFDKVSVRFGGQFLSHNNVGDSAFPATSTTSTFDPATGQVIGVPAFNPTAVPVTWRYNKSIGLSYQVQNDYAANFKFGPVTLQPVAGWFIHYVHNPIGRTGQFVMTPTNLLAGDFRDPRPDINSFTFANRGRSNARQKQAYVLTKAGFLQDRIFVVGGVTRTWVSTQTYSYNPNTLVQVSGSELSGHRDNYLGSLLVKPLHNIAVYYTYSTNASLVSFNPGVGVSRPLWSQGRQHEFGVKTEFYNQRLSFSAAHFQMAQTNVTSPNPLANIDPVNNPGNILTDNTSRGMEFNANGGVTKNLSVIASYTLMKYRDAFGRKVRNVPDEFANLMANYKITDGTLKNLNVFGTVSYNGKTAGESQTGFTPLGVTQQVGFYVAAWTAFNAGAGYVWGDWRFNLNVDNVFNQKFGWQPASRLTVSPYPGTTVRLTTVYRF